MNVQGVALPQSDLQSWIVNKLKYIGATLMKGVLMQGIEKMLADAFKLGI